MEHIAKKHTVSITDSWSGCHLSRKAQHLSDINNNGSQHETTAGLTDKFRRQKKTHPCVEMDVEPDAASVSYDISSDSGFRRSTRISNKQKVRVVSLIHIMTLLRIVN